MDKSAFINKRVDDYRPKTLKRVKPKQDNCIKTSVNMDEPNVLG